MKTNRKAETTSTEEETKIVQALSHQPEERYTSLARIVTSYFRIAFRRIVKIEVKRDTLADRYPEDARTLNAIVRITINDDQDDDALQCFCKAHGQKYNSIGNLYYAFKEWGGGELKLKVSDWEKIFHTVAEYDSTQRMSLAEVQQYTKRMAESHSDFSLNGETISSICAEKDPEPEVSNPRRQENPFLWGRIALAGGKDYSVLRNILLTYMEKLCGFSPDIRLVEFYEEEPDPHRHYTNSHRTFIKIYINDYGEYSHSVKRFIERLKEQDVIVHTDRPGGKVFFTPKDCQGDLWIDIGSGYHLGLICKDLREKISQDAHSCAEQDAQAAASASRVVIALEPPVATTADDPDPSAPGLAGSAVHQQQPEDPHLNKPPAPDEEEEKDEGEEEGEVDAPPTAPDHEEEEEIRPEERPAFPEVFIGSMSRYGGELVFGMRVRKSVQMRTDIHSFLGPRWAKNESISITRNQDLEKRVADAFENNILTPMRELLSKCNADHHLKPLESRVELWKRRASCKDGTLTKERVLRPYEGAPDQYVFLDIPTYSVGRVSSNPKLTEAMSELADSLDLQPTRELPPSKPIKSVSDLEGVKAAIEQVIAGLEEDQVHHQAIVIEPIF